MAQLAAEADMRPEIIVGGICVGLITAAAIASFGRSRASDAPVVDPIYAAPAAVSAATVKPTPSVPRHHWVTRRGPSFGYQTAMSDVDQAAGLATKALVMVDFNGMVQGDYSFTSYDPITGNAIIMRCAEPCEFMNVMNYNHRTPETFPVTPGSVMDALVQDARAGFLNP
jgi:hypothetical protein